jgi:hypothetical protein
MSGLREIHTNLDEYEGDIGFMEEEVAKWVELNYPDLNFVGLESIITYILSIAIESNNPISDDKLENLYTQTFTLFSKEFPAL